MTINKNINQAILLSCTFLLMLGVGLKMVDYMSNNNNSTPQPLNSNSNSNRLNTIQPSNAGDNLYLPKNISLIDFLREARISPCQDMAFQETNKYLNRFSGNHLDLAGSDNISSYRYDTFTATPTDVESILDKGVRENDLPIESFTLSELETAARSVPRNCGSAQFFYLGRINALELHKMDCCKNGDIINLASQFNALESTSSELSPVKDWRHDFTQGPMASLQAVAAAKHRESASLQRKLPDALEDLLSRCMVDRTSITNKYRDLYQNGYLQLWKITDINDLRELNSFLKNHVNEMKFLSQWVKCEGSEKKQLQVFTAAPSFQDHYVDWKYNKAKTNLYKECCITLITAQYRGLAQAAKIRSNQIQSNINLHVTMVGQGAFRNPPETIPAVLNVLNEELQGCSKVSVHLHHYMENYWEPYANDLGLNVVSAN